MGVPYAVSSDLVSAYPAKSLAIATYLDDALASKSDTAPAINAQTGTTYTFVLADATAGKTITASNAAASTYTVPPQSSVTFVAGALLQVTNLGAGVVTFAGGVGVTVTNTAATLSQYQTATLMRTGSDAWTVIRFGATPGFVRISTQSPSAASSVIFNDVFSATYSRYYISSRLLASTATYLRARMRVSSTDYSGNDYYNQQLSADGSSTGAAREQGTAMYVTDCGTVQSGADMNLTNPFLAQNTSLVNAYTLIQPTTPLVKVRGCALDNTTSYTGITFYPDSGTITGQITIFGIVEA